MLLKAALQCPFRPGGPPLVRTLCVYCREQDTPRGAPSSSTLLLAVQMYLAVSCQYSLFKQVLCKG